MTKPEPVCGALTHKKTPCQNTLVTGCGLCPVHASQLRAANPTFKQKSKARRKKFPSTLLHARAAKPSPSTCLTSPPLDNYGLTRSSHTNHRTPHATANPDHALLSDHFLYNITPVQQPQPDFYQDQPDLHPLKTSAEVVDILKSHSLAIVSPVTPRAPDSSLKGGLFEDEQLRGESQLASHSPSSDTALQASADSYLLECDIPMDLPMPKFD